MSARMPVLNVRLHKAVAELEQQVSAERDAALSERDNARIAHEGQLRNTLAFMREAEERKLLLLRWMALDPLKVPELLADTRKALGL